MEYIIKYLEKKSLYNQNIILVRCLLALNALITIIFNDPYEMTNKDLIISSNSYLPYVTNFSLFNIFDAGLAKYLSIIILIFVFTGFLPAISSLLQTWVLMSLCMSFIVIDGGDQIASNISLLLVPICIFDPRTNQWYKEQINASIFSKNRNVFFGVYFILIKLQVAVIYLHAGVAKLFQNEWRDGTSSYYWFSHNTFGAPPLIQEIFKILTLSSLSPLISWTVIFLELGLFACILATNKIIKTTFLFLGLFFHFSIFITHGLLSFFFSMAGALIIYLDDRLLIYNFFKKKYYGK